MIAQVLSRPESEVGSASEKADAGAPFAHLGMYGELIQNLFGSRTKRIVCAFAAARAGEGVSTLCHDLCSELSIAARPEDRIALISGGALLEGRSVDELRPDPGLSRNGSMAIWSWPMRATGPVVNSTSTAFFGETLQQLRARYDYLLIDCPPLDLPMSAALAASADKVVLVVREGGARRRDIVQAQRELMARHARLVGSVLLSTSPGSSGKR